MLKRQQAGEKYLTSDYYKIEQIYEQKLAGLTDRYGKRIAYIQSIPIVMNIFRDTAVQTPALCPLLH